MRVPAAILLLAATSCGGVLGPGYAGEPLATVRGELTTTPGVPASPSIRLALAWFPSYSEGEPLSRPKGIITEDVVYEGSFPLNYRFDVRAPPPRDAMGDWSDPNGGEGGPAGAAIGILLAYEDRNGNARLDTIPADGTPIDRVLGASLDVFGEEAGFAVVYFDGTLPNPDPVARQLVRGFNLLRSVAPPETTHAVVPFETAVPIRLTGDPELDIYVCDAFWNPSAPGEPTGSPPCGIGGSGAQLGAYLESAEGWGNVLITVADSVWNPISAAVTLNGTPIPQGFVEGQYELRDDTGALLVPGQTYAIEAKVDGAVVARADLTLPGAFAIEAPAPGAALPRGAPVAVSWTASARADEYAVAIESEFGESLAGTASLTETAWTSPPIDYAGPATVTVRALDGSPISSLYGIVIRQVAVDFAQ